MDTKQLFGYPLTNFFEVRPKTGNLEKDIVSFIKLKEGGLTDNPNDSASKNVVGVPYTFKGKTTDKWHTNKGITWAVFKSYAPKLGYAADPNLFYQMPDDVWLKIYKEIYYKPFANLTTSPLINYYVSLWAWGSGVGGANALIKKLGTSINDYLQKHGEKQALLMLIKARIAFYERLIQQKPQNKVFLQGWVNSAISFFKNFDSYSSGVLESLQNTATEISEEVKKKPWMKIVVITLMVASLITIIKTVKK
jgi:hypothetical protein